MTVKIFQCQCGKEFRAREADRKRGWARSCSKSCAASRSNQKTGKFKKYLESLKSDEDPEGLGWDAHKDSWR